MASSVKPNLLFIFADQWRRDAVGFRRKEPVYTPNIDRFAEESLVFDQAVSCYPLCSPNRSSILTGRFPLSTGVTTNCKLGLPVRMNDDELTFGNVLSEAGYDTGYIGKWHLDEPEQNTDPHPASGAAHWDAYTPPGPRRFGFDFWYSYGAYDQHMSPHYWGDSPEMIRIEQWSLEHETDVAKSYIRNRDRTRPFALFVSWNPPHQPFDQVPERYRALYEGERPQLRPNVTGDGVRQAEDHLLDYYAAVSGMDEQFERLMETLREEGIAEDTIVVLTSDHGETMGAHGWLEHKNIWYEEAIGVPLLIRWPGQIGAGTDATLVNSVDLMPTLLGLMSVSVPDRVEGADLSAGIRSGTGEGPTSAFICRYPGSLQEHEQARSLGLDVNAFGWRGIRTPTYTYVVQRAFATDRLDRLLYDNEQDPYQMTPLHLSEATDDPLVRSLERELLGWLESFGDPFRFVLQEVPRPGRKEL